MNEEIFAKLCANKKYGDVHPDAIRRAIEDAERRYRKPKDVEKAARERLHGITSAFNGLGGASGKAPVSVAFKFRSPTRIEGEALNASVESEASSARDESEALSANVTPDYPPAGDPGTLEALLSRHASTRERLPLARMDALYGRIFEVTGAPRSVLDLACGLNPLYLLRRCDCPVTGVDVSRACVELLSREPKFTGIWADLLSDGAIPSGRFHVALLFKILPLLERQRAGSASEIMGKIDAEFLVASFPTRTLGGRNVNMERNYTEWMEAHLPANRRVSARFVDENELFYILREVPGASEAKEK